MQRTLRGTAAAKKKSPGRFRDRGFSIQRSFKDQALPTTTPSAWALRAA
jgi:hypothetical protein